jgi:geranylgeranyl pyrophosphate synthase
MNTTELIPQAIDYLLNIAPINTWDEAVSLIKNIASHPLSHWSLPATACLAVGGSEQQSIPTVAAIIALHTSIIMVDDLLDNDGRFESMGLSKGDIANLALGLQATALNAIAASPADITTRHLISTHLNQMMVSTALGQHLDAHRPIQSESDYWAITHQKSAPFFGSTFYCGALAGGAPLETAEALLNIGYIFGEMIQIHDDFKDSLTTPASQDWSEGHYSLPILFAMTVEHPERELFSNLKKEIQNPSALKEAQSILVRCGALSYCTYQLFQRYQSTQSLLSNVALPQRNEMDTVLKKTIVPAIRLFEKAGITPPISIT